MGVGGRSEVWQALPSPPPLKEKNKKRREKRKEKKKNKKEEEKGRKNGCGPRIIFFLTNMWAQIAD